MTVDSLFWSLQWVPLLANWACSMGACSINRSTGSAPKALAQAQCQGLHSVSPRSHAKGCHSEVVGSVEIKINDGFSPEVLNW